MKKISIMVALLAFGTGAIAQDGGGMTNKKGISILPESGEFGLGFNATPLFNYMGNAFNGNGGNSINNTSYFVNADNMIFGKYMADANTAYRARVRIRNNNFSWMNDVVPNGQFNTDSMVTDKWNRNDQLFSMAAGLEKRRGKGRVQGVYGAEAFYMTQSIHDSYTYGNAMGGQFIAPETTTNFTAGTSANSSNRVTDVRFGRSHGFGINAFAGVEYFFAAKISISGEFTWGAGYTVNGRNRTTMEEYDNANGSKEVTTENAGSRGLTLDTGNHGGAIAINFYF